MARGLTHGAARPSTRILQDRSFRSLETFKLPNSIHEMPQLPLLLLSLGLCSALAMIVHELGHLVAARRCKVAASELGLGLGPRVFSFRLGSLRFSLRALPLGSFLLIDGAALTERSVPEQLFVHLGGIIFNLIAGLATYGTMFSWLSLLLAAGNLLPLYQHDGWKCGVVIMRALLQRKSQPAEWVFTFSGGFLSLVIAGTIIRLFI
jgi:membrane-associated protease RseP (regulator of RpoE activity)